MSRIKSWLSQVVKPWLEDLSERSGKQSGQKDQVPDQCGGQHDQHQRAKTLRWCERRHRENEQPQATDDGGLSHRGTDSTVRFDDGVLPRFAFLEELAEPRQEVNRVVDRDAHRDAGGHHRSDVHRGSQVSHDAEYQQHREHVGNHRNGTGGKTSSQVGRCQPLAGERSRVEQHDHHETDQHKGEQDRFDQTTQQRSLGLVDNRHDTRVDDLWRGGFVELEDGQAIGLSVGDLVERKDVLWDRP